MVNTKLQKRVYESKKARDILDDKFTEFRPKKRNVNEFFNIYNTKFYNILKATHDFFSFESLKHIKDYVNPKTLQVQALESLKKNLEIDINSLEYHHPIFPNNTILRVEGDNIFYYLIQSGKRRMIVNEEMINKVKNFLKQKNKNKNDWTIEVPAATIAQLKDGGIIKTNKDLEKSIYTINTGRELPSNIYIGGGA